MGRGLNMKMVGLLVHCAVSGMVGVGLSASASQTPAGGNMSAAAGVRVEPEKPNSMFKTDNLPPAPDYGSPAAWAALPDRKDNADLAPPNTKYPESQAVAAADVFFIHPTTLATAPDIWNVPFDDPAAVRDLEDILGFCASVFNAAAKVYAPRYREVNFKAFFNDNLDARIQALNLAYGDVERAFLHYMKVYNQGRPFIIAGHSQGSMHGSRLLQEKIVGTPLMDRLVAAYLIGGVTPAKIPGIRPARSATDTGVLIGWNTYTKSGDPTIFMNGLLGWINGSYSKMGGRPLVQVNPLSWELNGPAAPASRNPGSLPAMDGTKGTPLLVPAVCGADASGRVLIINKPAVPGFAMPEKEDSPILNTKYGDYHNYDYQLFYESIRKNALDRVKAFLGRKK
jgi:hypothetical protein